MFGKEGRKTALDILYANPSAIGPAEMRLATNVPAGTEEDWALGDFTECTFAGYAGISNPNFSNAVLDGSDRGELQSDVLTWTAAAITTPQTIRTIYYAVQPTSAGPFRLLWAKEVSPTVTLTNPGETFIRQVTFKSTDFTP